MLVLEHRGLQGVDHDSTSPIDDLAPLLGAAARGDNAAWSDLVKRYARRVYALARSRVRNHDVAEELTQSVFATVAEKLGSGEYAEQGKFESWLFRVAANRIRDYVRRLKHRPTAQDPDVLDTTTSSRADSGPDEQAVVARVRLRSAMEQLTDADREIVELRHHGGLSFKQIADILGEPMGTLLARHHRALRKLKELLEQIGSVKDGGEERTLSVKGS